MFEAPTDLKPAGYDELVRRYSLKVMPHYVTSFVTAGKGRRQTIIDGHKKRELYPLPYYPGESLGDHLTFALKYEGVSLEILAAVFQAVSPREIEAVVRETPTGKYARQIWFLYEFLTGKELDLEPLKIGNYIDVLDEGKYITARREPVSRQRINNNLLGDRRFCPLVRKTEELKRYQQLDFQARTKEVIGRYPEEILQRAVAYLFTKETKSSFEIERATPDQKRAARFVELLRRAGEMDFFTRERLIELQQAVVDARFAIDDFRKDQNYVGQSVGYGQEIVHFVPPRPDDLAELMAGMFSCHQRMMASGVHSVIAAAIIAFGFVFMHPFDDGNGRIHRFLIHNILAKSGFTPQGMIFPVSATLVQNMKDYDQTLELFSKPLLPSIDFDLDELGQMRVKNDTALHYRYIDMTAIAERMFGFIEKTIDKELVAELDLLVNYDRARAAMREVVDMPDRMVDLFMWICRESGGRISRNKRNSLFAKLTDDEVAGLEECVRKAFGLNAGGDSTVQGESAPRRP
jgi:hypothetical protein